MKNLKPILTLIAISMIMPELATGSTNLFGFLNPTALVILFVGYGIAVLLIREFFVRNNLNYFGLFLLGFAYLIVNEGLLAKTMILQSGIPNPVFDNYGYMFGISVPWSFTMGLWHSIYSVMFPIVAAHFLFPKVSKTPWLNKKVSFVLLLIPFALGILFFFGSYRGVGTVGQFSILVSIMIVFIIATWLFGKKTNASTLPLPKATMKHIWWGVSMFFVTILLLVIIAGFKMPLFVFFAVFITGILFYLWILKKIGVANDTLLLFILGGYFQTAITGILIAVFLNPSTLVERLIAETIIIAVCIVLVRKVFRKKNT